MKFLTFRAVLLQCYLTFFSQFYSLTRDYFQFKTSTRVTYQVDDVIPVPAATICFRGLAPMWDMHLKAFKNKSGYFEKSYNLQGPWLDMELGRQCKAFGERYSGARNPSTMIAEDKARLGCLLNYYDNPSVRQYLSGQMFNGYFWCRHAFIEKSERVSSQSSCRNVSTFCESNDFVLGLVYPLNTCLSLFVKNNDCLQIDKGGHYYINFNRRNLFLKDNY